MPRRSITSKIIADCRKLGIVGEKNLLLALYMVGTSRLLDKPLSAIVRGKSSTGKSYTVSGIARLFPTDQVIHATRMSPQALYHMESVAHKFVVAGERSRSQDDNAADATAALRQLQSEGQIVKQITVRGKEGFETETIEQTGPIAYVETTTLRPGAIFPEDLNRALLLGTDESEAQTRAILSRQAQQYQGQKSRSDTDVEAIVTEHREFQSQLQRRQIVIPFAVRLMEQIPAGKIEARRASQQILSMIEAVTLLHQFEREPDEENRLVATLQDYEIAAQILRQPLGNSLGLGDSATKLYGKLADEFQRQAFTTTEVQKLDGATDRAVRNWLTELSEHGCIDLIQKSRGRNPATWRLNGRSPDDVVLPRQTRLLESRN